MKKAVIAGAVGAAGMEAYTSIGLPLHLSGMDFVAQISAVAFSGSPLVARGIAVMAHLAIGVCWAIFYAFFIWGRIKVRPLLQGLIFAALPALLAILITTPELTLMRLRTNITALDIPTYVSPLSPSVIASILIAHAIFGLIIGAIYRKPVGYPIGHSPKPPVPRSGPPPRARREPGSAAFMFTTGIECSYPTIHHGKWRRDELDSTGHYRWWQRDFELAREIGITHIRYGPPLHLIFRGPGKYVWDYADAPMAEMRDHGPQPIIDLCHFGLPAWLGNCQNPDIGKALAEYAGAFAERYSWVRFYTPVNEMYVCSRMSALDGLGNEQLTNEGAFARAAWNLANASVSMTDAILKHRQDAVFINSESSEFYQPCCPDPEVQKAAKAANDRRFLPLDLIYAHELSESMHQLLLSQGISQSDIDRLARRQVPRRSILGVDYYEWNERLIDRNGQALALGELFGWYVIARQYWQRYRRTMMHTETNKMDADGAARWLWRQWHNVQLLAKDGVPLVGFTWYSLNDQIDWSIAMSEAIGIVYPVGLVDLNREPRSVGLAYRHLIDLYKDLPQYRECEALRKVMD